MVNNKLSFLILSLIILILTNLLIVNASQVIDTMEKGNTFYREGEYEKAIDEYNKLVDEGHLGTSLFYNLGNSYYRIGKIGLSILYYERALKLSPSDEDIKHNLNFARLSTVDRIQPLPTFFLFEWWEAILNSFTENGWAYIVFILYLLVIYLAGSYFFARSIKQQKLVLFSGVVALFVLAISISLLVVKINREATAKSGVILEQFVTVKSSPDPQSTDSFVIHEGLKVNLEDNLDEWVKIRLADGKVGWIENNYVEQI
ncbi:MAG: tetratricopeptide repeat protein [Ignavibacterium sp.]|nr:MAG: tetratricopeptide repeat protein [Ignavibacterium sp.]